ARECDSASNANGRNSWMVVFVSGSLTLLASHLWHPDAQHAEAVEAHKYGAAFVSNNPDRQHQTESERRDDEHNDYGQRECKILVNDPPGVPAEGKSEDYVSRPTPEPLPTNLRNQFKVSICQTLVSCSQIRI
ncbi:MAG: hypothetical protein WBL39_18620, partial [Terrimicrobiaceae bacterium]